MKLTALAVVILALGIIVGFALATGTSEGPALAVPTCPGPSSQCPTPTPAPPQQREDQITIFGDAQAVQGTVEFSVYEVLSPGILFALDPADYPASADYRLEAVMRVSSNSTQCVRLLSRTAAAPVAGSDACFATGPSSGHVRVRSLPFSLPSGETEYTLEAKFDGSRGEVFAARIIVEWTE